jgi:peptidoglycan/LPS O-acetylase OafA/YrhL
MRRRRERLEDLKMWACIIPACTIGGLSALYLHESFPQWEAPAVFISLGLGILAAFWYWRVRRYGWVIAFVATALLTFSTIVAIFHGWETQVAALYIGAAVVFIVAVGAHLKRALSHLSSAMREIGGEVSHARRGMFFHDDGQRIVVYPRRYRLVTNCLIYVVVLLVEGIFAFFILKESSASTPTFVQIVVVLGLGLFVVLILHYGITRKAAVPLGHADERASSAALARSSAACRSVDKAVDHL